MTLHSAIRDTSLSITGISHSRTQNITFIHAGSCYYWDQNSLLCHPKAKICQQTQKNNHMLHKIITFPHYPCYCLWKSNCLHCAALIIPLGHSIWHECEQSWLFIPHLHNLQATTYDRSKDNTSYFLFTVQWKIGCHIAEECVLPASPKLLYPKHSKRVIDKSWR